MKRWVAIAAVALAAVVAGAGAFIYSGVYDVSATNQHLGPTYRLLDLAMKRSVKVRASGIAVPALDAGAAARGQVRFEQHCVQCHGAPGVAPHAFALGLTPAPTNLVPAGAEWSAAELYWVVRHGLKMTGMPGWEFRLREDELWDVVAFVKVLPTLSPADYARMAAGAPRPPAREEAATAPASAERGRLAVQQYACVTCHEIPGIVGANAHVGPSLRDLASRAIIAGSLPNTPATLADFLRRPHAHKPAGAMPDLQVTQRDARDMATFLGTLR